MTMMIRSVQQQPQSRMAIRLFTSMMPRCAIQAQSTTTVRKVLHTIAETRRYPIPTSLASQPVILMIIEATLQAL